MTVPCATVLSTIWTPDSALNKFATHPILIGSVETASTSSMGRTSSSTSHSSGSLDFSRQAQRSWTDTQQTFESETSAGWFMAATSDSNAPKDDVPLLVDGATTVMLRNVPPTMNQWDLLLEVNSRGFEGRVDYLYMPLDVRKGANRGVGFINFITSYDAQMFTKEFHNKHYHRKQGKKPAEIVQAYVQGIDANMKLMATQNPGCPPLDPGSDEFQPAFRGFLEYLAKEGSQNNSRTFRSSMPHRKLPVVNTLEKSSPCRTLRSNTTIPVGNTLENQGPQQDAHIQSFQHAPALPRTFCKACSNEVLSCHKFCPQCGDLITVEILHL